MRPISFRYDRRFLNRIALFACVMILVTAFLPAAACATDSMRICPCGRQATAIPDASA